MASSNTHAQNRPRLRARYWLALAIVGLDGLAPFSLALFVPDATLSPALTALPFGLVLFGFAVVDRWHLGRRRRRTPQVHRVRVAFRVARFNWLAAAVWPLTLAFGLTLRAWSARDPSGLAHTAREILRLTHFGGA